MSVLFPAYYVDGARTGKVICIHCFDYALAGCLGAFYVLRHTDLPTFLKAFATNLDVLVLAVLAILAASALPHAYAATAAVVALLVLVIEQGRTMIRYVVQHFTFAGWDVIRSEEAYPPR